MSQQINFEAAIRRVQDEASFIQVLLRDTLGWQIDQPFSELDDIAYDWPLSELNAHGLDEKLVNGKIHQIQPLADNQPWGVFLLKFTNEAPFTTGKGLAGVLRPILRRLVASRRSKGTLPTWQREHLLFICTHSFKHFRIAYFKDAKTESGIAQLSTFGWGPDIPARTACEFNLPQLSWPEFDAERHPEQWVSMWASAFDVEQVTKLFYQDYARVFSEVEHIVEEHTAFRKSDDLRLFTQSLFNRLMFLRFIERKGWLKFNERRDYLQALFEAGAIGRKSLYRSRIKPLFFEGLAKKNHTASAPIGEVPFLNGGLFEERDLDRDVTDIPDEAFRPIIGKDGLFYRYNFTVEESTPIDIEVAVDPEMLGKVFEELVTGRHDTGSYYTPRPIVSFMCREALTGYLSNATT